MQLLDTKKNAKSSNRSGLNSVPDLLTVVPDSSTCEICSHFSLTIAFLSIFSSIDTNTDVTNRIKLLLTTEEAYSEPRQTSEMELQII